mgnify:CR=1 FL=1
MMTSEVKEIRIDGLPCMHFQCRIEEWKRYGVRSHLPLSARLVTRNVNHGVGIKPETLIHGWRELESRSHQLKQVAHDVQARCSSIQIVVIVAAKHTQHEQIDHQSGGRHREHHAGKDRRGLDETNHGLIADPCHEQDLAQRIGVADQHFESCIAETA